MRILHVVEVSIGGVISVVETYAQWQVAAGDDVHVLAPADAEFASGTRHFWNPKRRAPQRFPAAIRDLRKVIAEVEPDVVHLHSFFPGILGRALPSRGTHRPALVYQPHSWAFDAAPTRLGRPSAALWERLAARRTDAVIVNCQDERREGEVHGVKMSAHVVGIPIDTEHFAPASPKAREQNRRDLEVGDRFVLLCVGRLAKQKGQDRLVTAWRQDPIPGAVLVLLGAGDPAPLAQLAGAEWGRSIIAPGPVADVRTWLHAADLCVAPSRWESQEVAVAEALACGQPVVATEVNGAREAIADDSEGAAGAVVDQADMAGFLAACRQRVNDPSVLAKESSAARSRAERMFARDEVGRRVADTYKQAVDAHVRLSKSRG